MDRTQCRVCHEHLADDLRSPDDVTALADRVKSPADIMPNFDGMSEELDEWLDEFRRTSIETLTAGLTAIFSDGSRPLDLRLAAARYAYQLDPFKEAALRTLMRGYDEAGESPRAIQLYDAHYAMLDAELDVDPDVETQELAVDIKSRVLEPSQVPAQARAPSVLDSSLAVLPFECTLASEPAELVSLAVMDELICLLTTLRTPAVISGNSARRFAPERDDAISFGRQLGAQYVLTGRVIEAAHELRIFVEVSDTTNNRIISARPYRADAKGVLTTFPEIARRIVKQVIPSLHSEELRRIRNWSEHSLEANHLYLRARQLFGRIDRASAEKAISLLQRAVDKDPDHAPSHTLLAEWLWLGMQQGWLADRKAVEAEIEDRSQLASQLSADEGRARAMLGHMRWVAHKDGAGARRLIEEALDTLPGEAETMIWSVPALACLGETDRAVALGTRALALSPLDPSRFRNAHFLSIAHYARGDYEAAANLGMSSFELNDKYLSNLRITMAALVGSGQLAQARTLAQHHRVLEPGFEMAPYLEWQAFQIEDQRTRLGTHLTEAFG